MKILLIGGPLSHETIETGNSFKYGDSIAVDYTDTSRITAVSTLDEALTEIKTKTAIYLKREFGEDNEYLSFYAYSELKPLEVIKELISFYDFDNTNSKITIKGVNH